MSGHVWTVEITFEEDGDQTRADAWLRSEIRDLHGSGRAKRNPADPEMPAIGEELAAARALSEVTHKLVHEAARAIEAVEGQRVHLHT
jgi:hypothetical protein